MNHIFEITYLARKYGPLMHLKLGEVSTIAVSSPLFAKEVLKNHDPSCADRPETLATKIMWYDFSFCPYGEYWRQMRKICIMELLSSKNVRSFESIRLEEASRLVESIRSSSQEVTINLSEKVYFYISSITCRAVFGKVCSDPDTLINVLKNAVALAAGFGFADLFPSSKMLNIFNWNKFKLLKMHRKLDSILEDIIDEHQEKSANGSGESGDEDLVDVFLRLKNSRTLEFPIENENIKAIIFDVFSAGTETSSTTLDWAMVELMKNPLVIVKAQDEIRQVLKDRKRVNESDIQTLKYLKLVIKETLRLHPPITLIPRACREEFEINGYKIPLKAKVMINTWAMGRNLDIWHRPESFEPERFENNSVDFLGSHFEYIPFGSGRRFCPGMASGLATIELILSQLLYHFDWKFPEGISSNDLDMTEAEGLTVSRKENLYLIAKPYNPSIVD
ncbi:Cytochrome [Forsythia ovata]|uniref:Cytochrome n=1 Tax=Forsythia ovata TaxID=205694 RepID=A0ABD1WFZ9_9LAMI